MRGRTLNLSIEGREGENSISNNIKLIDENGEEHGCYGTNPHHGYTWEEAKAIIADWHDTEAKRWREMKHTDWDTYESSGDDGSA